MTQSAGGAGTAEVKALLRSIRTTQQRLETDLEFLGRVRAMEASARGLDYSRVVVRGGAEHQALLEAVVRIDELERKVARDIGRWRAALAGAMALIDAVENPALRILLIRRYRDFWSWEKIATEMGYTWRHIHRLHSKALREAQKIHSAKSGDTNSAPDSQNSAEDSR